MEVKYGADGKQIRCDGDEDLNEAMKLMVGVHRNSHTVWWSEPCHWGKSGAIYVDKEATDADFDRIIEEARDAHWLPLRFEVHDAERNVLKVVEAEEPNVIQGLFMKLRAAWMDRVAGTEWYEWLREKGFFY